jgi:hypothetical protein
MAEGPTSLSAHSKMAIGFLDRVAVVDRERGYNFDTRDLLDDLDQIVQAVKAPQTMSNCYPDIDVQQLNQFPKACAMPPIEASVAAIRGAQRKCAFHPRSLLPQCIPSSDSVVTRNASRYVSLYTDILAFTVTFRYLSQGILRV